MSKNKYDDNLISAIKKYIKINAMQTSYRTTFGYGIKRVRFGVFDPPDNRMLDSPEYRAKPVLVAYMNPDGSISVEETEYTDKYMKREKTAIAV